MTQLCETIVSYGYSPNVVCDSLLSILVLYDFFVTVKVAPQECVMVNLKHM